jgi:enoyl-CoA hydratase/carnithine racemase
MEEDGLLVERQERICTLTLNRPEKRNALSPQLLYKIADTLARIKEENEVRCLVIRGAGDKAFSSGFDISSLRREQWLNKERTGNPIEAAAEAVVGFPYPVIAMINGYAYGAGLGLAVACDIRLAAADARFSIPVAKLGAIYEATGILGVVHAVGIAKAREIFFTGRVYDAAQAESMGLVNHVLPADQLLPFTLRMAREIADNAPLSLAGFKTIFNQWQYRLSPENEREINALQKNAFRSEDFLEGSQALREKRKPVFKGK